LIRKVARTQATVLIAGESGTGKELVARALYRQSPRSNAPFIKVNCAAIPENLIESEFFGHEKGAFTGALTKREGRFELAHSGTILLDEISEISPQVQAKLLRVLQERELERVGGNRTIKVDVRVLATTNRRLEESVERKEFRQDLYFRLNVIPVQVPALREHAEDVPYLAQQFMPRFARKHGVRVKGISDACLNALRAHNWPGNVRELQNVIERAVILCGDGLLEPEHLGFSAHPPAPAVTPAASIESVNTLSPTPAASNPVNQELLSLAELEKRHIFIAMEKTDGNRTHAAKLLGISVRTLRNKLNEYGVPAKYGDASDSADAAESSETSAVSDS
jgi:DNA-binding NtrC family response regulator